MQQGGKAMGVRQLMTLIAKQEMILMGLLRVGGVLPTYGMLCVCIMLRVVGWQLHTRGILPGSKAMGDMPLMTLIAQHEMILMGGGGICCWVVSCLLAACCVCASCCSSNDHGLQLHTRNMQQGAASAHTAHTARLKGGGCCILSCPSCLAGMLDSRNCCAMCTCGVRVDAALFQALGMAAQHTQRAARLKGGVCCILSCPSCVAASCGGCDCCGMCTCGVLCVLNLSWSNHWAWLPQHIQHTARQQGVQRLDFFVAVGGCAAVCCFLAACGEC
jgi:hypothetical protein